MEIITTTHLLIFLICWYFNENRLFYNFFNNIAEKINNEYISTIVGYMFCLKCLTFWVMLIATGQLLPTLIFSFIGALYQKINKQ